MLPDMDMEAVDETYVYVDGFNLYYGALKDRPGTKWLDLDNWAKRILIGKTVLKIKYFTALVTGGRDPEKPVRQQRYLRALKTLPNVEIIEGRFLFTKRVVRINSEISLAVLTPEEKGTDVNLASHVLHDAHLGKFKTAAIVSNDSDLAEVVHIVTKDLGLNVGIINPYQTFNRQLCAFASFKQQARISAIKDSQFPSILKDSKGTFSKPAGW